MREVYKLSGNRTDDIRIANLTNPFVFSMYAIALLGFLLLLVMDVETPRKALKDGDWLAAVIWTLYVCVIFSPYLLAEYLDAAYPNNTAERTTEANDQEESSEGN